MIFSLEDLIAEIDRELAQRGILYPVRITAGTLDQDTAARQIAMLQAIHEILVRLLKAEKDSIQPTFSVDKTGQ